ncbi:hypothetical protein D3C81_1470740 [compost metagenome]
MNFMAGSVSTRNDDTSAERSRRLRTSRSTLRRIQRSHSTSIGISSASNSDNCQDNMSIKATAPISPITADTAENSESTAKRWISATSPSSRERMSPMRRRP